MDVDFEIVAGTQNVLTEKILRTSLVQRPVQDARAVGEFAANVDIGQLHVVSEAGDDHALDELVRILVDDLAILEGAWLGFVGIADKINRLAAPPIDETPFESARETRPSPAAQAGQFHVLADLLLRGQLF